MPLSIPNTTVTSQSYTDPLTFAGNDVFQWGFFTIANTPVFAQVLQGPRGQAVPQPEVFLPPGTYPIATGARSIAGIRFRAATASTPAPQVFGQLFYPNEPGIQAGNPFTGTVSPSGAVGLAGILDRIVATNDIVGTAAETSLYSLTLAGGTLGSNGILLVTLEGDYLHANGAADSATWRVKFGGTSWWVDATTYNGVAVGTRFPWRMVLEIQNRATNVQRIAGDLNVNYANATSPTTGEGRWQDGANHTAGPFNQGTALGNIDTTLSQSVQVTVQWSAASGNNSVALRGGWVELK